MPMQFSSATTSEGREADTLVARSRSESSGFSGTHILSAAITARSAVKCSTVL